MLSFRSRTGNNTCVKKLVPRIRQTGKTPMDTICICVGIGLLLRRQHFALSDCVNRSVGIFPVFGEFCNVEEVNRNF